MPISEARFNQAVRVVETGIEAATACREAQVDWQASHAVLSDSLRSEKMNQDALLDLIAVALMKCAVARAQAAAGVIHG